MMRPQAAIELVDVRKTYPGQQQPALKAVSFVVEQGELFGLIGADGAGKSTLLKILATLIKSDAGTARVLGDDVLVQAQRIRTSIGYMPQRFSLYHDLSVQENMQFFADVFGVKGKERARRIDRLLSFSRLGPFTARRAGNLSGGMKQKLALCCALMHAPRLLLLDEPTTGVDPLSRNEFWGILQELISEKVTILVSTPYMDETRYCSKLALMHEGSVMSCAAPNELLRTYPHAVYRVETNHQLLLSDTNIRGQFPDFVKKIYPAGGEIKVVTKRGVAQTEIERWIRESIPDVCSVTVAEPVMEDVFIEQVDG